MLAAQTHRFRINCLIILSCNCSQILLTDRPTKIEFFSNLYFWRFNSFVSPLSLPLSCWQHCPCSGDPTKRSSGPSDHDSGILSFNRASFGANLSVKCLGSCLLIQYYPHLRYGKSSQIEFPQNSY